MKIVFLVATFCLMLTTLSSVVYAKSINDNFNNGRADGWWLGNSRGFPTNLGRWSFIDGTLVQNSGFDGVIGLKENELFSNQVVNTDLKLFGRSGGGIILWYIDDYNMIYVVLSNGLLEIAEWNNNVCSNYYINVDYNINEDRWVNLKVVANSDTGEIKVYMDGEYQFTYTVTTFNRTGQTGVMSGNAGAFDNFKIKEKIH